MVANSSKKYAVSTVLFHKYGGENVVVKIFMSRFSMFIPTNAPVKLANENTGHAQEIEIILCHLPTCTIIYIVGPVYYCPDHPSNTISLYSLKCYVSFQKVAYEPLKHCDFVDP